MVRGDFLVVDTVAPNRSPQGEFPINRENNWEYLDFWVFWPKLAVRNDRFFSVLRRKFPKPRNRELFSTNWELFWWNREF